MVDHVHSPFCRRTRTSETDLGCFSATLFSSVGLYMSNGSQRQCPRVHFELSAKERLDMEPWMDSTETVRLSCKFCASRLYRGTQKICAKKPNYRVHYLFASTIKTESSYIF